MKKRKLFYGMVIAGIALFSQIVISVFLIEGNEINQESLKWIYILSWLCVIGTILGKQFYLLFYKEIGIEKTQILIDVFLFVLFSFFTYLFSYQKDFFSALNIALLSIFLLGVKIKRGDITALYAFLWMAYMVYISYQKYLY